MPRLQIYRRRSTRWQGQPTLAIIYPTVNASRVRASVQGLKVGCFENVGSFSSASISCSRNVDKLFESVKALEARLIPSRSGDSGLLVSRLRGSNVQAKITQAKEAGMLESLEPTA